MKNFMDMSKSLMLWGYHEIFENKKPQIKAPRVTPLEGVYTYALQGIRGCGVENPQGFDLDKRGFVIAYLRLFAFICGFLDSNIIKRSAAL